MWPRRARSNSETDAVRTGGANFRRIFNSPRSKSNSLISFSLRNSTSSFNSLSSSGVMNLSSASELRPRGGCRGQYLPVLPGYGNHIFDAHSKLTWNVNAGLNGDDHSRQKGLRLVRGNAGCLMNFEPHAMTGGMTEVVSQAGFAKDAARCVVYVTTGDSWLDRRDGRHLRLPHSIIREALPACRLTQENS